MYSTNRYLNFAEQVAALKELGITFEGRFSERTAQSYLRDNNSFFRLSSYCGSFEHTIDPETGKQRFQGVGFEQLVDLSVIDFRLREILLHLILHIEHHLKIHLQHILRVNRTDPYEVVKSFKNQAGFDLLRELEQASRSDYSGDVYAEYEPDIPSWVMLELLQLGQLQSFVGFLRFRSEADTAISTDLPSIFYELTSVRSLRNAAAHNTGILNGLLIKDERELSDRIHNELVEARDADGVYIFDEEEFEDTNMSRALKDITSALYLHHELVSSPGVKESIAKRLAELRERFFKRISYPEDSAVGEAFSFMERLIDLWHPLD